jgi:hypothetical protein
MSWRCGRGRTGSVARGREAGSRHAAGPADGLATVDVDAQVDAGEYASREGALKAQRGLPATQLDTTTTLRTTARP